MAETQTQSQSNPDPSTTQYWCYHCDKRVSVESQPDSPDLICRDCNNGFVESISAAPSPQRRRQTADLEDSVFGNQFLNVLRLIADAARESDAPPPPSEPADPADGDHLRFQLQGWDHHDAADADDDENNEHLIYNNENLDEDNENEEGDNEISLGLDRVNEVDDDEDIEGSESNGLEDEERRRRRVVEALRRTLIGEHSRGRRDEAFRRNRILDWAEILMGLEDHSIELRLQVPEMDDSYIGNPGDYVDAAGYEALLQNLAESDNGGRRGAPPASKSAVEGLETVVIKTEDEVVSCSVCKDLVNVGEPAKKLPCGHLYHGDCIVPWLGARNSCPICRFELPTDDPEYEEERMKKVGHGKSSSSSGVGVGAGVDGEDDGVHPLPG